MVVLPASQRNQITEPKSRGVEAVHRLTIFNSFHTWGRHSRAMPYISTEALVGAALVAVLAFGYQHIPTRSATSGSAKSSKKKNKKKNKGVSEGESRIEPAVNTKGKQKREKGAPPKRDTPPTSTSTATAASTVTPNDLPVPVEPPTFAHKAGNAAPARAKTLAEKIAPKPRKTKVDE